jgi:hypothetical protein
MAPRWYLELIDSRMQGEDISYGTGMADTITKAHRGLAVILSELAGKISADDHAMLTAARAKVSINIAGKGISVARWYIGNPRLHIVVTFRDDAFPEYLDPTFYQNWAITDRPTKGFMAFGTGDPIEADDLETLHRLIDARAM